MPIGLQRLGCFDEDRSSVEEHAAHRPGDHDLLDQAATDTLIDRGTVYIMPAEQVPGDGPLAAILRF